MGRKTLRGFGICVRRTCLYQKVQFERNLKHCLRKLIRRILLLNKLTISHVCGGWRSIKRNCFKYYQIYSERGPIYLFEVEMNYLFCILGYVSKELQKPSMPMQIEYSFMNQNSAVLLLVNYNDDVDKSSEQLFCLLHR